MTKDRDFKRLIRARMAKTGESYTAARAHLLAHDPPPLPDDYEKLAGMSDAAVEKATGKRWPEWTAILDRERASELVHRDIVALVGAADGTPSSWWAQMVTVAYERFRGLRDVGQRRGGGWDVNRSRTIGVPIDALWSAFEEEGTRASWLPEPVTIRTAVRHKSMRMRLADDSPLNAYFTVKGDAKSVVTLEHLELPDRESADEMKARWGERLDALKALLTAPPTS